MNPQSEIRSVVAKDGGCQQMGSDCVMGAGSLLYQWALSGTRKHSWWLYNFTNVLNTTELCTLVNFQIRSVALIKEPCPTLCDPMNRSTPGLPVHHQLPEFTHTHVHRVGDAIQPSHPLSSSSPPAPNPSQHQSLLQWVNSSHEVAKVLEFQVSPNLT